MIPANEYNMSNLETLNELNTIEARSVFIECGGSEAWATRLERRRPFESAEELTREAEECWEGLSEQDWLQAFATHPRIGDLESLRDQYRDDPWAHGEQAGTAGASDEVLESLAQDNFDYEARFGYTFIVFATGKSADEMLEVLRSRLMNKPEEELEIAAAEQRKIAAHRLQKWLVREPAV